MIVWILKTDTINQYNKDLTMKEKEILLGNIDYSKCPKCGVGRKFNTTECHRCGVIFSKAFATLEKKIKEEYSLLERPAKTSVKTPIYSKSHKDNKMIVCPSCSKEVSIDAKLCRYCGTSIHMKQVKGRSRQGWIGFFILIICAAFFLYYYITEYQKHSNVIEIQKIVYREAWPFSVSKGVLSCEKGPIVLFQANGRTYGLNELAVGKGYPKIDQILLTDQEAKKELSKTGVSSDVPFPKANIKPILEKGLRLCK